MKKPNPNHSGFAGYHQFKDDRGERYGSFEVCWIDPESDDVDEDGEQRESGWYWAACFPGCLPDGDWEGPYASSRAAYREAINV